MNRGRTTLGDTDREIRATLAELRRITGSGDLWTAEAEGDYGGQIFHLVAILELSGGKILRETRYYAEPFEAPPWRAHLVERAGEAAT